MDDLVSLNSDFVISIVKTMSPSQDNFPLRTRKTVTSKCFQIDLGCGNTGLGIARKLNHALLCKVHATSIERVTIVRWMRVYGTALDSMLESGAARHVVAGTSLFRSTYD